MRIIVTGANGFVGRPTVRQLMDSHEVLAVDSLRYGPWRFAPEEARRFRSDTTDLRDLQATKALIADFRPEAIIHLAAVHFIPECERAPDEAISTNVTGAVSLLRACPEGCKFVFASTAAVYAPSDVAHREDVGPLGPMDVYGLTKLSAEQFVSLYAAQRGFPAAILRLFNVVGPGETNPHVLPEIIKQLKRGDRTLRLGNTSPKRDYIYVEDAARGFIAAMGAPPEGDGVQIANLGTNASYSVAELVDRMARLTGLDINVVTDPSKVRPVDRPQLLADNTRMQRLFGWKPEHDIDSALEITWRNPDMSDVLQ